MPRITLEKTIEKAAAEFAGQIISAVKTATLQDLIVLQGGRAGRAKPGPKPGSRRKPGRKPRAKTAAKSTATKTRKKRVVKNYPKCAFPRCNNNRFPRGKGFCGDHWRKWEQGKIKDAAYYKGKGKGKK